MSLESLFHSAVDALVEHEVTFAVAGGLAADLYRHEPRLTMDVDLAIATGPHVLRTARTILKSIGLVPGVAREADLAGGPLFAIRRNSTRACMVVGRPEGGTGGEGVDILLPAIPWVTEAVTRAQDNRVDYGFGPVPVLTVEDVIVSKLYALSSAALRAKDLDDLQSIYEAEVEVDVAYLAGQMRRFEIVVPREAEPFLDHTILRISRDIARRARSK